MTNGESGMEVVPSSGGAVIRLDPQGLKRLQQGLNRAGMTFVELSPIIRELRDKLAEMESQGLLREPTDAELRPEGLE